MGSRAILLSLIFLLSGIIQPSALVSPASAGQVTHFGNSGFPPSVNISFAGAGYDSTTNLTMGANALVSTASFDVRGWPDTGGNSPTTIGIDVGDDGDLEWAFGGSGNGSFGHVNEFSNGWHHHRQRCKSINHRDHHDAGEVMLNEKACDGMKRRER